MTEADLFEIIRGTNTQIASLYGQVISINFAMVVAVYYFLNRSRWTMKFMSFLIYLIGMLMFVGLMLEESNVKVLAYNALAALPAQSAMVRDFLALRQSWLFTTTSVFLNLGLWTLPLAICFLLFFWRRPESRPA
ncbi:MAG: hypothetical protein HY054_01525 [Proteobacteria bacterium]|nr:hypothetical protein [Pseudomonadota bacterium]